MMWCERTTTGLIIHEPTLEVKRSILMYFSLKNPVREFFIYSRRDPNGTADVLYVTSGAGFVRDINLRKVASSAKFISPSIASKIDLGSTREPRSQLQRDCIDKLLTTNNPKVTIQVKPGVGKTFIALYTISKLGKKPLIICPTTNLKNQWIENFIEEGIPEKDIAKDIFDAKNKKLCVVTISAIEIALRENWKALYTAVNDGSFGIKVIDEAHLHLKGIMKFESICNIERNWYLSATLGRSAAEEDNILNRMYLDAERFIGNQTYDEYRYEYINVYIQDIFYHPSDLLCESTFKYGSKGLIKSTYYKMLMDYKLGTPYIQNLINIMKRARGLCDYGSMVVVIPMIEIIDRVVAEMDKDDFFSKYNYGSINGSMSRAVKEKALQGDIIISTIQSIGTGVDIPGLSIVINTDAFKSAITLEQEIGRNRKRKDGLECFFIDVNDHVRQAKCIETWGRKRQMIMQYIPGVKKQYQSFPAIYC